MASRLLVDAPHLVYSDIEDGQLLLIQSVLVKDSDKEMRRFWEEVDTPLPPPLEDAIQDNEFYLSGKARIRKWQL